MKTVRILVALMAIPAVTFGVACSDDDGGNNDVELCTNGVDDDGDALADCSDPDCATNPWCTSGCNGNGVCDLGESNATCPNDCPATVCDGDGICDAGENPTNCPNDCQVCNNNGTCDSSAGETNANCAADCPCNNNGTCEAGAGETAANCNDCVSAGEDLACYPATYCMYTCCGDTDTACQQACLDAASSTALTEIQAINTCGQANCASQCDGSNPTACSDCLDTNCASQVDACGWEYSGSAGCLTTNNCLVGCDDPSQSGTAATCPVDDGLTCYNECYLAADQNAITLLDAIDLCVDTNCSTECANGNTSACQSCYQAACTSELSACQSDG